MGPRSSDQGHWQQQEQEQQHLPQHPSNHQTSPYLAQQSTPLPRLLPRSSYTHGHFTEYHGDSSGSSGGNSHASHSYGHGHGHNIYNHSSQTSIPSTQQQQQALPYANPSWLPGVTTTYFQPHSQHVPQFSDSGRGTPTSSQWMTPTDPRWGAYVSQSQSHSHLPGNSSVAPQQQQQQQQHQHQPYPAVSSSSSRFGNYGHPQQIAQPINIFAGQAPDYHLTSTPSFTNSYFGESVTPNTGTSSSNSPTQPQRSSLVPPSPRRRPLSVKGQRKQGGSQTALEPSATLGMIADTDRPRSARNLACSFCRGRKLRCVIDDGRNCCRQCHRRGLECVLPHAMAHAEDHMPKAKKRRNVEGNTKSLLQSQSVQEPTLRRVKDKEEFSSSENLSASGLQSRSHSSSLKSDVAPNQTSSHAPELEQPRVGEREGRDPKVADGTTEKGHSPLDLPSAARADLAASQPSDTQAFGSNSLVEFGSSPSAFAGEIIPTSQDSHEPITAVPLWANDWWDSCLGLFGPRQQALKMVKALLVRFVKANSSMTSILHGPTFFEHVSRPDKRKSLQPALVYASLAAALCDLRLDKLEPYTADVASADATAKGLVKKLRGSATEFIEAALASPSGTSVPLAHAAVIMALMETSSSAKNRLLSIAELVVRSLKLPHSKNVQVDEPELIPIGAPVLYQRPSRQATAEAEIRLEMSTRICKAHVAIATRQALIKPDEDNFDLFLPDFVDNIRAFGFWQPSQFGDDLPESYHSSTHFAKAASVLGKTFVRVARLPPFDLTSFDHSGVHQNSDIWRPLQDLERLEGVILWMRDWDPKLSTAIFPLQAQNLLVKMHVFTRMSLWRKSGIWTLDADRLDVNGEQGPSRPAYSQVKDDGPFLPSFQWWFLLLSDSLNAIEADNHRHTAAGSPLATSELELDSAIRHVRVAIQICRMLLRPPAGTRKLLRNLLAILHVHTQLRSTVPVDDISQSAIPPWDVQVEALRADLLTFGEPSPEGALPPAFAIPLGAGHATSQTAASLWSKMEEMDPSPPSSPDLRLKGDAFEIPFPADISGRP